MGLIAMLKVSNLANASEMPVPNRLSERFTPRICQGRWPKFRSRIQQFQSTPARRLGEDSTVPFESIVDDLEMSAANCLDLVDTFDALG
jgi:hypothetical protein